jgi:hypothetical protein
MRDFRDAKVMARALRDALKAKAIEPPHSEALELIAKAFAMRTGTFCPPRSKPPNRLQKMSACLQPGHRMIRCRQRPSTARFAARASTRCVRSSPRRRRCSSATSALSCASTLIEPELAEDNLELFRLMRANEESGVANDPVLLELARRASTEEQPAGKGWSVIAPPCKLSSASSRCGTARCPWTTIRAQLAGGPRCGKRHNAP